MIKKKAASVNSMLLIQPNNNQTLIKLQLNINSIITAFARNTNYQVSVILKKTTIVLFCRTGKSHISPFFLHGIDTHSF